MSAPEVTRHDRPGDPEPSICAELGMCAYDAVSGNDEPCPWAGDCFLAPRLTVATWPQSESEDGAR